jgi:hypothetical protein
MMFHFYIPEGICFAAFVAFSCTWLYYAVSHLCFLLLCVFVSFLILGKARKQTRTQESGN